MSIEKENKKVELGTRKIRRGATTTNKVKRIKHVPLYVTSGNVTMATSGAVYKFPNPYGATKLQFMGVVTRRNQNGFVLTVDAVTRIPVAGKVYYLEGNEDHTIVITGSSSNTSLQAIPTNPDYPTIPTGTYLEDEAGDDVFGTSNFTVTSVSTPVINIRVSVDGIAHLRPAYYFAPQSSTSVAIAARTIDPDGNKILVQCGRYFLVVDENASASTPEYAASSTEGHLVNIVWNGTIVARATLINYSQKSFEVAVTLFDNWVIDGNFICT